MHPTKPLNLGSFDMHPDERLFVDIELGDNLSRRWERDHLYRAGDYVRPGNGFAYIALEDFSSGYHEPRWPIYIGTICFDGSGRWQTRAANYNGIDVINNAAASLPSGLSLFSAVTWEGSRVRVPVSGGVSGSKYECFVEADTVSGQTIVGMFGLRCSADRR